MPQVDQRGFDNQPPEFLESHAAAALLGVQERTLYAYASRGLISRVRDGRRSRYARADLERLKARHDARAGHGPVAGGALRWGEPVLATKISAVGPEGPRYRGHLAADLIRQGTPFLAVCQLLWTGELAIPTATAAAPAGSGRASRAADPIGRMMEIALAGLHRANAPFGLAHERELQRARALVLGFAGAAGPHSVRGGVADPTGRFLAAFGVAATAERRRLVDAALVACADHELNASTFAARVAASTGADLQACVLAALATFLGPRHGAASRAFEALLDRATPARAEALVQARTSSGEGMPGFGHPLYPQGDPRATALLALLGQGRVATKLAGWTAVVQATARIRGERPNIDAALVAVTLAVGLPRGAAVALFAVGRTAGWVAHVFEQRESPAILRPRARYVGP